MRRHATHARDSSLRRLNRVNRWLLAGSLTLTGVLTEVVAHAFPGSAHASSSGTAAKAAQHKHPSRSSTHGSTSTGTLKPPAQAPEASESSSEGSSSEAPTEPAPEAAREAEPAEEPEREPEPAPEPEVARQPAPEAEAPVVSGGIVKLERPLPSRGTGCASWQALGTSVVLRTADPAGLSSARKAVESQLAAIDRACSRFRADSELSRLNDRAGRPVQVSPLLFDALALALDAASITDGDVDPTLGRALELAGYDRDWRLLPSPGDAQAQGTGIDAPVLKLRTLGGWRSVSLDARTRTVRLPHGVRLDLGATAKALAADRAATAAYTAGGHGVLVSLGGDIATAGPAPAGGWRIHVTDDHRSDATAPGQTISIRSGGLATSSTTVRRWRHAGRTLHHILDPATGNPAHTCWRTVSVAADSCAHANIACTASLVRGRAALDWLAELELPAMLQDHDGSVTTIGHWPAQRSAQPSAAVAG